MKAREVAEKIANPGTPYHERVDLAGQFASACRHRCNLDYEGTYAFLSDLADTKIPLEEWESLLYEASE